MLEKNFREPLEALESTAVASASVPRICSRFKSHTMRSPEQDEETLTSEDYEFLLQLGKLDQTNKKSPRRRLRKPPNKNQPKEPTKTTKSTKISNSQKQKLPKPQCDQQQHKLTEYFPIRRSIRKPEKLVLKEKQREFQRKITFGIEDGLEVTNFDGKGRGVTATRDFFKGEFVVEYAGELIDSITAKEREAMYSKDSDTGCYMYYFRYRDQQHCVDATAETGKLGRLINHSRNGNLATKIVEIGRTPHLVFVAKENIKCGTEFCYDYGDRSSESLRNHPWLAL